MIKGGMNWWEAILTIFIGNIVLLIPMVLFKKEFEEQIFETVFVCGVAGGDVRISSDDVLWMSPEEHDAIVFFLPRNVFRFFIAIMSRTAVILTSAALIGRTLTTIAPFRPCLARPFRKVSRFVSHVL